MFGYVTIDKAELKVREFEEYHAYYCGLCHRLQALYGLSGRMTLSYDLTFLTMLLTGLYEPAEKEGTIRCMVHPLQPHPAKVNRFTDYAAAMNVLLAACSARDDWEDEHSLKGLAFSRLLQSARKQVELVYPEKSEQIKAQLKKLREAEEAASDDLDYVSGIFGELMAILFTVREDMWTGALRSTGFFLGKFIYLMDAYEDLERDIEKGLYNPLLSLYRTREHFDEDVLELLTMMISEAARSFEFLPILKNASILKNVLYAGVWTRYRLIQERKKTGNRKSITKCSLCPTRIKSSV